MCCDGPLRHRRLHTTIDECVTGFTEYNFAKATDSIYGFWLYDFCDVYLELSKLVIYSKDQADDAVRPAPCLAV